VSLELPHLFFGGGGGGVRGLNYIEDSFYPISGFKTSGFKSIEIKASLHPIFKFDLLIKQKV
jgi:hypothetical protein